MTLDFVTLDAQALQSVYRTKLMFAPYNSTVRTLIWSDTLADIAI